MAPTGGNARLTSFQKASHVAEMTQDGFTMVDRSKTYASVVARQSAPQKKAPDGRYKGNTDIDRPATIRGVLTTAIDNQRVISTKVTLPGEEKERRKALIKALDRMKLRKALYKAFGIQQKPDTQQKPAADIREALYRAFGIKPKETQDGPTQAGPTIVPLSSLPSKHPKATTLGCEVDQVSPTSDVEQTSLATRVSSIQTRINSIKTTGPSEVKAIIM